MLFNSNSEEYEGQLSGEAVWMSTSPNGYSNWTAPQQVLTNMTTINVGDMADARPIWDGTQWHVFVQACEGYWQFGCSPPYTNNIYEAIGPTLTSLDWVRDPGTQRARVISVGLGDLGIGELVQAFNTSNYGGAQAGQPILVTFNDWSRAGNPLVAITAADAINFNWWYDNAGTAYDPVPGLILPDAMLSGTQDAALRGHPGIGFESGCKDGETRWQYATGMAFYDEPASGHQWPPPPPGAFFQGPLESVTNDARGPRMYHPRLARNIYGYLDPIPGSSPRTWSSFLYYNDAQISDDGTCRYTAWDSVPQRFSVSYFEIREHN